MGLSTQTHTYNQSFAYRFYPLIPAKFKLLPIDEAIFVLIKDSEYLLEAFVWHIVDVALVIAEQSTAD